LTPKKSPALIKKIAPARIYLTGGLRSAFKLMARTARMKTIHRVIVRLVLFIYSGLYPKVFFLD